MAKTNSPTAGGPGLMPDQRTRPHMLQLKILHAALKMEDLAQSNKQIKQSWDYKAILCWTSTAYNLH